MNKNNKIIIAAIAVVALLLVIGALFASGILSGNDDDNDTTYKVSFIDGDDVIKTLNVKENNLVSRISDPEKEGYIFTGWYSDKELTNEFDFENTFITENTNIYAKWVKASEPEPGDITFTVTFNTDGANSIASQTVKEGEKAVKPADPLKSGYKFEGWYSDSSFTTKFDFKTPITFDITLYAKFTVSQGGGGGGGSITPPPVTDKTYTVTFNSNGGSAVNPITADYNAPVTLPTPTREGHTFAGWYSDESLNTQYTSDKMPAENITLFAKWTKNSYTLTINYVYENGSEAHESYVKSVVYGEAYTVTSPSIESFLPDIPTVTGIMPANDLTIVVTYGDYLISIDGNNYRTIEDALASAQEGDRLILLRDYTIQKDLTIPKGILLVLPCSDDDVGYDLTAEYEKEHNPDGTSTNKGDLSVLYRTLTIPSGVTLNIEGQLLVNAVTGRPAAGHYDMDITGGYSQIILDGNITVKNGGLLEVCGYVKGEGLITAESGAELRDLYVVKNWRGGSQAFALFPDVFPFNEYDCHNIQSTIQMESGASLSGNVKMYASGSYHYTRFPQVDNENGLIRLADGAHLIKTYADYKQNGSSDDDIGRTSIVIYGGATFSHSTLPIVGLNLSTKSFIYPVDGDINFGLYDGNYIIENDFKLLTGVHVILGGYDKDTTLTLNKGNTLVLYDEFNDVDNTSTTEYPNRPAAELVLYNNTTFNINGKFAGIISIPDFISSEFSKDAIINAENAEALSVDTIEANGYLVNVPNDYPKFVNLHFETKYQYTLSFETNGGLKVSSIEYFVGEDIEIPTPIKTGYDFKGWYLDSNLTQKYEYEALTGNTTLYAKWEDSKYTVSFETNRGSSVDSQEILFNNTVTKPSDPIRSGYVFEGWYSDAALTSEYNFSTLVTENLTLYAKWTAVEYTISFVTNNGENLDSIKYTADDASLNIQELSKTGYTFEKWCIDEELTTGFEFKQYETSGDLTLYAKWVPVVYTIKYYDGTQLNLGPSSYTIEDSIALPTATKLGYEFAGWHENSDLSGDATFSINKGTTGNKEYYASWNESVYSITYMDGETKIENLSPASYTTTKRTELPTPSKEGYTFNGWYNDVNLTEKVSSIPMNSTGDKIFYAKFTINQYTITFNSNGGSAVASITANYDTLVTKPVNPTKMGYTFAGWFKDDGTFLQEWNFETDTMPVDGTTLYANWTLNEYTITLHDGDSITTVNYDVTMDSVDLGTPSKTGYTFKGWFDESLINEFSYVKETTVGDLNLYAKFTINQYTITFNSNGGSAVASITADYDKLVTKPADPTREGYTFAGWFKDDGTFLQEWNFETDTMPVDGTTLYANWTANSYSVIFNANGGKGSMENQPFTYDVTQNLTTNAFTKTGYEFLGWSINQNATEAEYTDGQEVSNLTSENGSTVTLHAVWQINKYTITFNSNDGSAVDSITAEYNASVTLLTPTREGHKFVGWYSDESLNTQYTSDKMPAENITLYAKWDIIQYTITFDSNGGSAVASITADYDKLVTKPENPTREGYTFAGWFKDDGTFLQEWNFETDTMPVDGTTLYANWMANSYNVIYYVDSDTFFNKTVAYGTSVPKPADPIIEGYTFVGWDVEIPLTMPARDLEFHAIFEINNYTITYVIDGTTVQTQTYAYGAMISPYEPDEQVGKTFSGWSPDLPDTMPDYSMTVSGSFDANTFTITYYVDGVQYETPQSIIFGETVTPIGAPTKEGYSFSGWDWNGNEGGLGTVPEKMPAEHLRVDGYFTINSYNVTFYHNNGTDNTTTSVEFNTLITEPTNVSKLGYTLEGWYSDSNFNTKWDFTSDKMPAHDMKLYAKWTAIPYTINFYNETELVSSTTYTVESDFIEMPSNPSKTGYTFKGWFDQALINEFSYSKGYTVGDLDLHAKFTINQYKITFDSNGGSEVDSITQDYATAISEPADPTKMGYTFVGWYTDGTFNNEYSFTTMPADNITLYAKWTKNSYSIKYYDGGSEITNLTPTSYSIDSGEITLQAATKTGYTFAGWYDNADLSGNAVTSIQAQSIGDKVLYAKFVANSYLVSFNANGGKGSMENQPFTYDVTQNLTTNAFTKTGYEFLGWSINQNATEAEYTDGQEVSNLTSENGSTVTLHAVWQINKYTITFNSNDGSAVDSITAEYNASVTLLTPTREGHKFVGWYSDESLNTQYTSDKMPAENITLYAKWTVNSYNVTFYHNNGTDNTTTSVEFNTLITEPTNVSKLGYTLEGWYSDSNFNTKWNFASDKMPSQNIDLYANWTLLEYTITFNLNGGPGPIADMQYTVEKPITLPAPKWNGYVFDGWYESNSKFEYIPGETVGDHDLIAKWTAENYTITYMDGNSRITAESGWPTTYTSENATTLPTSATKTGYTFAGWYDNADLSGNAVTSIPAQSIGDKVLYAKFVANSYLVSFNANSGEGSMEDQSFTYDATQKLTANSFKKKGYTFLGWSLVKDATKADYTDGQEVINLTPENGGLVTLYAVWEITKYKIYYVIASDIDELTFVEDSTFSNTSLNPSSYTINDRRVSIIDGNATYGFVTRDGYTFSKWTVYLYPISGQPTEPDGISRNGSLRVSLNGATGDLIAISHWTINKYTITFDSTGGSEVPSKTIEGDYKSKIVKPIDPTKEGYTFAGWYKDVDCKDVWDFNVDTIPAKNITLYAGWTSGTNTVTLPSGTVNGYEFTSNASTGFDESNVPSGSDFKFNVTFNTDLGNNIPTITWDDNIKSPDSQNGLTYQFTIPDVTNDITISLGIVDTTALKEFVNNAASSNYKLSIDKWILTVEISNPNADASILIDAISAKIGNVEISTNPNSGRTTTNLLAYLPDDNMLWENNLAEYIVEVAGYKIIFKQDEDAVEEAKIRYLTEIAQAVRVFRNNPDYYPLIVDSKSYSEIFSISAGIEDDNYKFIDIGVLQTHSQDNQNSIISLAHALASNYATVTSLVGHEDALWGRYDLNADFSNAILKDPVDLNIDLLDTKDIQVLYRAALVILKDMQIPIDSAFSPVEDCFNNGVGYGGYGKYYCASVESGIRYTDIYHIKFTNYFEESKPASHTISFSDNILDKISLQNFATHNSLADVTFDAHNAENHVISETGLLRVTFNTNANKTDIYKYELSRLVAGELIVVNINQNSKLTMSDIAVTTSSGANVEWYNSNSFIMPDGNVTISLKGEQTETLNIIHSLSLQALVQERSSAVTHLQILS